MYECYVMYVRTLRYVCVLCFVYACYVRARARCVYVRLVFVMLCSYECYVCMYACSVCMYFVMYACAYGRYGMYV